MNMITGNTYLADVQIKSPMGWVKVGATLTLTSETDFSGSAKLLGFTVALTDCSRSGSTSALLQHAEAAFRRAAGVH